MPSASDLAARIQASQDGLLALARCGHLPLSAGKFDNRPTWDNKKKFDNRPGWDNWNKRRR